MAQSWTSAWRVDFAKASLSKALTRNEEASQVVAPVGYKDNAVALAGQGPAFNSEEKQLELKHKGAWQVAMQVGTSLPMNLFMMWMAGDSVHIFSIMMTGMLCRAPIMQFLNMKKSFERFEDGGVNLLWQKLTYLLLCFLGLMLAAYKLKNLGLLPTTDSDWLE